MTFEEEKKRKYTVGTPRYKVKRVLSQSCKDKIAKSMWKGGSSSSWSRRCRPVIEKKIGRKLKSEETVHHLDHNPSNNHPDNLVLFPNGPMHLNYHAMLRYWIEVMLYGEPIY